MQDPNINKICRAGGEEEEDSQNTSGTPDTQVTSQSSETGNDHRNSAHDSQPQDSATQAIQHNLNSRRPAEARVVAEEAATASQGEQAPVIPGPSGDAATAAGSRLLELYPFRGAA
ncbi:cancer/testis antigen 2 [Cricetulus griseus]